MIILALVDRHEEMHVCDISSQLNIVQELPTLPIRLEYQSSSQSSSFFVGTVVCLLQSCQRRKKQREVKHQYISDALADGNTRESVHRYQVLNTYYLPSEKWREKESKNINASVIHWQTGTPRNTVHRYQVLNTYYLPSEQWSQMRFFLLQLSDELSQI